VLASPRGPPSLSDARSQAASSMGVLAARSLGFRKGSLGSKYTQLYVGFLTTGAIHMVGGFYARGRDLGDMPFFLGQAAAITFENMVMACVSRMGYKTEGPGPWARILGYVWVAAWLGFSMRASIAAGRGLELRTATTIFSSIVRAGNKIT
jgi:hypothetical protein